VAAEILKPINFDNNLSGEKKLTDVLAIIALTSSSCWVDERSVTVMSVNGIDLLDGNY